MNTRNVVVIGGGLAGITAAISLREAGIGVTLLEARPWLGGATCSFSRGGLMIDNGQHVFLRCCTSYRELLARLGVTGSATVQDRFDVTVLSPGGRARLRRSGLPGPLHFGRALAGYKFLSLPERLRVGRAALAMRTLDPAKPGLDSERLGDWLARPGAERAHPPEPLGPVHRVLAEHRTAMTPACRWLGHRAQDRAARRATTPRTSASPRCRSANCTARPRPACWRLGAEVRLGHQGGRDRARAPAAGSGSGSPRAGTPRTARTGRRARAAR